MKRLITLIALAIISFVTSCITNEIEEVNTEYLTYNDSIFYSKSVEQEKDTFTINIINKAKNIILCIDESKIKGNYIETNFVENNITVNYGDTICLKQFESYKYDITNDTKIILKGKLLYENNNVHYEGIILIPIYSGNITNNVLTYILKDNCKWTDENGNILLCSISFNVSVDSWYEENINI